MRKLPLIGSLGVASLLSLPVLLTSCSGDSLCSGTASVADTVSQLNAGIATIDPSSAVQLQVQLESTLTELSRVANGSSAVADVARGLKVKLAAVISALNSAEWDLNAASESQSVTDAIDAFTAGGVLQDANSVDAFVITKCGLPSTASISRDSVDTLPSPSVPAPDATDPPMNTLAPDSDAVATGQMVANLFRLTLNPQQVACLGTSLQGVVDSSGFGGGVARYQKQFQSAFDACKIPFTVPEN